MEIKILSDVAENRTGVQSVYAGEYLEPVSECMLVNIWRNSKLFLATGFKMTGKWDCRIGLKLHVGVGGGNYEIGKRKKPKRVGKHKEQTYQGLFLIGCNISLNSGWSLLSNRQFSSTTLLFMSRPAFSMVGIGSSLKEITKRRNCQLYLM